LNWYKRKDIMFTVYTKENCPQCETAKQLLKSNSLEFNIIQIAYEHTKLEENVTYMTVQDFMHKYPTVRAMPFILKDETAIGGLNNLKKLLQE